MTNQGGYYPTAIHANYAITPAPQNGQNSAALGGGVIKGRPQTLVVQRHVGQQKLFSVGGPSNWYEYIKWNQSYQHLLYTITIIITLKIDTSKVLSLHKFQSVGGESWSKCYTMINNLSERKKISI